MRKFLVLAILLSSFCFSGFAQQTVTERQALANEEIKTELVSRLKLSDEIRDKILASENEFYSSMAAIQALGKIPLKEKEKKLGAAHVTRRAKLMDAPLTGRQMEDVIELVEAIRRKHKL